MPAGSQPLNDAYVCAISECRMPYSSRDTLEDALRDLTPEKTAIASAMAFCVRHAHAAQEIVETITESLSLSETPLHKKIARLYLISDILHNCSNPTLKNMMFFRK